MDRVQDRREKKVGKKKKKSKLRLQSLFPEAFMRGEKKQSPNIMLSHIMECLGIVSVSKHQNIFF